jgi:hypothetical protein
LCDLLWACPIAWSCRTSVCCCTYPLQSISHLVFGKSTLYIPSRVRFLIASYRCCQIVRAIQITLRWVRKPWNWLFQFFFCLSYPVHSPKLLSMSTSYYAHTSSKYCFTVPFR